ncbi:hypothetical protein FQN49_006174 [Arthroderma sp. PD_2]|nr:hypothetical protein FQN49_006174 [Arthroderma sp. PD_2]
MAVNFLAILLAIIFISLPVLGGNQAWEPSIKLASSLHFTNSTEAGVDTTETTLVPHEKRGITIRPRGSDADYQIWPNMEIKYCFEDRTFDERDGKSTREIVFNDLVEARELWHIHGLPRSFNWVELGDSDCNEGNRANYLLIVFNTDGRLGTTVGMPPKTGYQVGPRMTLSDSLNVGMLNVIANYAHEIGHAWGLHHEHQNEAYWAMPYSNSGGTTFGPGNFHCQNLADYDRARNRLMAAFPGGEWQTELNKICTKRAHAEDLSFSAAEYLPVTSQPVLVDSTTSIDWESIMLYPSGAGGRGSATHGNDQRLSILTKPDNSRITPNIRPSRRDIAALTRLYGYKVPRQEFISLGSKRNPLKRVFDKIRRKAPGSPCNTAM